jgi:hypothetical protein
LSASAPGLGKVGADVAVPANEGKGTASLPLEPLFTAKIQKAQKA